MGGQRWEDENVTMYGTLSTLRTLGFFVVTPEYTKNLAPGSKGLRLRRSWGRRFFLRLTACLCAGLLAVAARATAQESPQSSAQRYEAALVQARVAKSPAELTAAAVSLNAALSEFPQDVELPLQLAWVLFQLQRYDESAHYYRLALSIGERGSDAELGLAWSLLRMHRNDEARAHFQTVIAARGSTTNAAQGLRECEQKPADLVAPLWLQAQFMQSFYVYQNQPVLARVLASTMGLSALLHGRYFASALYRYSFVGTGDGQTSAFAQHDLYLSAGLTGKLLGATLQYGLIVDGSGYAGTSNHVGLSARYSPLGDILLNLSASLYSDVTALRGELLWNLPLYRGFGVRPGFALQGLSGQLFETGSVTLYYEHPRFGIFVGGKYGDEKRAAYLANSFIYNGQARIPYGVWGGVTLRLQEGFKMSFSYAYDRMLRSDVTPSQDFHFHSLNLSFSRAF